MEKNERVLTVLAFRESWGQASDGQNGKEAAKPSATAEPKAASSRGPSSAAQQWIDSSCSAAAPTRDEEAGHAMKAQDETEGEEEVIPASQAASSSGPAVAAPQEMGSSSS